MKTLLNLATPFKHSRFAYLYNCRSFRIIWSTSFLGSWKLSLVGGRGPGYIGLKNFEVWIGAGVQGGHPAWFQPRKIKSCRMYVRRFSAGFTRNGNAAPYVAH